MYHLSGGEIVRIETNETNINKLYGNDFWFAVPTYQRPYLWKKDNVSELLDDLWNAYEEYYENDEDKYFLGSLVLCKRNEVENDINYAVYDIVDGQQRLTTLMLLIAVLRDITNNNKAKKRLNELIRQEEDEFGDIPEKIKIEYKIRDDVENKIIRRFILPDNETKNNEIKNLVRENNISISNMANAILAMHDFFKDDEKQQQIDEFIKFLLKKITFVYVSTEDLTDAFKLFSVLNNRGIPLTNADILKAENIGYINEEERERYAKSWENLENYFESIGENYFDRFLSFIRTICLKEKARKTLYEEFKKIYDEREMLKRGKGTINLLNEYNEMFNKIIELNNFEIENNYKNLITIMKLGIKSDDWIPPLLYFWYRFRIEKGEDKIELKNNLITFLKKLEFKFSSDWIIGYTPTKRLESMNKILKVISKSNNSDEVLGDCEIFIVDTKKLKEALNEGAYGKRYAKYILLKYTYLRMENDMVYLSNIKNISIEHILPQKPKENSQWMRDFSAEEREYWTNKLANLVLISGKKNSSLRNLDFKEKLQKLKELQGERGFGIFDFVYNEVEKYHKWTPDILKKNQDEMVDKLIYN